MAPVKCIYDSWKFMLMYVLRRWIYCWFFLYWPFQCDSSFVDFFYVFVLSCVCYVFVRFCLIVWSPAGKGLTSWLSFVVSNCEFVTFPLVSWVGCGTWLYRFLTFAALLTCIVLCTSYCLWGFCVGLCFGMHCFMSFLVSQSSWRGRESWLLCFYCHLDVVLL